MLAGGTTRDITANNNRADSGDYMGLLDGHGGGTITDDELGAYQFDSTAGSPTGRVNNCRIRQSGPAPYTVTTKGEAFYIQDSWTLNQWTVNAGVRTEQWGHFDSFATEAFTFDWALAPPLSVVSDPLGDGRSTAWCCIDRCSVPILNDMTPFRCPARAPTVSRET